MSPSDQSSGGLDYVRCGPEAGGNSILRRSLGFLLWWRVWATGLIFGISMGFIVQIAPTYGPPRLGTPQLFALIGWFTGLFTATLIHDVVWNE